MVQVFVAFQQGDRGTITHASVPAQVNLKDTIEQLYQEISSQNFRTLLPHNFPDHILCDRKQRLLFARCDGQGTPEVPLQSSAYVWEVADRTKGGFTSYLLVQLPEGTKAPQYMCNLNVTFYCQKRAHLSIKNTFWDARYDDKQCTNCDTPTRVLDVEFELTFSNCPKHITDPARARHDVEIGVTPQTVTQWPQTNCLSNVDKLQGSADEQSFREAVRVGNNEFLLKWLCGCSGDRNMYHGSEELVRLFFYAVLKGASTDVIRRMANILPNMETLRDDEGNSVMHYWARATNGRVSLAETGKLLISLRADVNAQRCHDKMSPLHHLTAQCARRRNEREWHKVVLLCRFGANIRIESSTGSMPHDQLRTQNQRERFKECCDQNFSSCPVCRSECYWVSG